jgi:cellulose synthase/poly-beta-1,6-N-acetylglucosamine synthase-like glycosyltransferase
MNDNPPLTADPVRHSPDEQATDTMDALDILMALSVRQYTDRLAEATGPMPTVRPVQRPVSHRKPRHPVPRDDARRPPVVARGWFEKPRAAHIAALIPAHNEEASIGATIRALQAQTRRPDEIIVVSDNSTDATADVARLFPEVTVVETEGNTHRKSGALNQAWWTYAQHADIVIGVDGDTVLPPHAVADWEKEFAAKPKLGGSSSQPVMTGNGLLRRIQRAEFTKSATISLRRGWCRVISGTGCAFRGEALREASRIPGQDGPWTYESVVEDYHLTYRLRQLGWLCEMSPTVWCWTGSMKTIRSLWHQRIKWTAGTLADLLRFGFNRLNYREWVQQGFAIMCMVFWVQWLALNITELAVGHLRPDWTWLACPLVFSAVEMAHTWRIRGRDWKDMLIAGSLLSALLYTALSMGWNAVSWWKVIGASRRDLWASQYHAEAAGTKEGAR